jgi:hypothetical protein
MYQTSAWWAMVASMSRTRLLNMSLALAALAGIVGIFAWWNAEESAARERRHEARQAREDARRERDAERAERLIEESAELMPDMLEGLFLGMEKDDVAELRRMQPKLGDTDPTKTFYEELLANGAQVVYGFDRETDTLAQIQVLSILPSGEAFNAHFTAMIESYGRPTGAWDCPDTGGVPTRRFTWRRARTTLADIFLIYGDRISVTLFIAPTEVIGQSLARSRCVPVSSYEQLLEFPTTSLEAITESQENQ